MNPYNTYNPYSSMGFGMDGMGYGMQLAMMGNMGNMPYTGNYGLMPDGSQIDPAAVYRHIQQLSSLLTPNATTGPYQTKGSKNSRDSNEF